MMFMSAYIPAGCPNNGSANGQPHSGTTQASQSNHLKQQAPSTEKVQGPISSLPASPPFHHPAAGFGIYGNTEFLPHPLLMPDLFYPFPLHPSFYTPGLVGATPNSIHAAGAALGLAAAAAAAAAVKDRAIITGGKSGAKLKFSIDAILKKKEQSEREAAEKIVAENIKKENKEDADDVDSSKTKSATLVSNNNRNNNNSDIIYTSPITTTAAQLSSSPTSIVNKTDRCGLNKEEICSSSTVGVNLHHQPPAVLSVSHIRHPSSPASFPPPPAHPLLAAPYPLRLPPLHPALSSHHYTFSPNTYGLFERRSDSSRSHCNPKRKRSWSRAVFSALQRKGLEKRFEIQKYVTKPDRRQLAAVLGLTDAQVKVWFQNRRMKWRHMEEQRKKQEQEDQRSKQQQQQQHNHAAIVVHNSANNQNNGSLIASDKSVTTASSPDILSADHNRSKEEEELLHVHVMDSDIESDMES